MLLARILILLLAGGSVAAAGGALIEVESILGSGPATGVAGILLAIVAYRGRRIATYFLALLGPTVFAACAAMIAVMQWGPMEAAPSVVALLSVSALFQIAGSWFAWREWRFCGRSVRGRMGAVAGLRESGNAAAPVAGLSEAGDASAPVAGLSEAGVSEANSGVSDPGYKSLSGVTDPSHRVDPGYSSGTGYEELPPARLQFSLRWLMVLMLLSTAPMLTFTLAGDYASIVAAAVVYGILVLLAIRAFYRHALPAS